MIEFSTKIVNNNGEYKVECRVIDGNKIKTKILIAKTLMDINQTVETLKQELTQIMQECV